MRRGVRVKTVRKDLTLHSQGESCRDIVKHCIALMRGCGFV